MKKMQGEVTADNSSSPKPVPQRGTPAAALAPRAAILKEQESAPQPALPDNNR